MCVMCVMCVCVCMYVYVCVCVCDFREPHWSAVTKDGDRYVWCVCLYLLCFMQIILSDMCVCMCACVCVDVYYNSPLLLASPKAQQVCSVAFGFLDTLIHTHSHTHTHTHTLSLSLTHTHTHTHTHTKRHTNDSIPQKLALVPFR